jgi:hypothetical protein
MLGTFKSRVVRRTFWLIKVVPTWKKFEKRWCMGNQDGSVGNVLWLRNGWFGFRFSAGVDKVPSPATLCRDLLGMLGFFCGVRTAGRRCNYSPPSTAEVKSEWSFSFDQKCRAVSYWSKVLFNVTFGVTKRKDLMTEIVLFLSCLFLLSSLFILQTFLSVQHHNSR